MLFVQNKLRQKASGLVNRRFWSANSQKLAQVMIDLLIKEIEKGNFDFFDEDGNILLNKDGSSKIGNLGGVIWKKLSFLYQDLVKGVIGPYLGEFNEAIPHEKKHIEFLEKAAQVESDASLRTKLEALQEKQKKELKAIETSEQLYQWMKTSVQGEQTPLDQLLLAEKSGIDIKAMIISCLKTLSPAQRAYISFAGLGYANKDIAEIFGVTPAAVTQTSNKGAQQMKDCLKEKGIGSLSDLIGGAER
jgi:hypothetical protein